MKSETKAALGHMALFVFGGAVVALAECMLGGAYYPQSIAGAVWRCIFM
jgi:hypothetical protein